MHCDLESPFTANTVQSIGAVFVYSFLDCAEACAGTNLQGGAANCTLAVYKPESPRPANCWIGRATDLDVDSLDHESGTQVAMLQQR